MAVTDKVSVVLTWSLQFRYQMLDRMKQDCEYFLGHGNRVIKTTKRLTAPEKS